MSSHKHINNTITFSSIIIHVENGRFCFPSSEEGVSSTTMYSMCPQNREIQHKNRDSFFKQSKKPFDHDKLKFWSCLDYFTKKFHNDY